MEEVLNQNIQEEQQNNNVVVNEPEEGKQTYVGVKKPNKPGANDPKPKTLEETAKLQKLYASKTPEGYHNPYDVDLVDLTMLNMQINPKFDLSKLLFGEFVVNNKIGFQINPNRNVYKQKYGMSDEMVNYFYDLYDTYYSLKEDGLLNEYSTIWGRNSEASLTLRLLNAGGANLPESNIVKWNPGLTDSLRALAYNNWMDEDGNVFDGTPRDENGIPLATRLTYNPKTGEPIRQVIGEGLQGGALFKEVGTTPLNYIPPEAFEREIAKGGKFFEYKEDGEKVTLNSVGYDSEGNLITNNKLLAGLSTASRFEIVQAHEVRRILEQHGIDMSDMHANKIKVSKDGQIIKADKLAQPTLYRDFYGGWDYFTHALANSYGEIGSVMWNMISNSTAAQNSYYKTLYNQYSTPQWVDESSAWSSRNLAKVAGDLAVQLGTTAIVSLLTAGVGGAITASGAVVKVGTETALKTGGKALLKKGVKREFTKGVVKKNLPGFLGKEGIKVTYKHPGRVIAGQQIRRMGRWGWTITGMPQAGYGVFQETVEAGIDNMFDARAMTAIAMGITGLTNFMLSPTFLRPGFLMSVNKDLMTGTFKEVMEKIGVQQLQTGSGKNAFFRTMIDNVLKFPDKVAGLKGWGGFVAARTVDGVLEGIQEVSEDVLTDFSQMMYNLRGSARYKEVGQGRYDTGFTMKEIWDTFGVSFLMGALPGVPAGVVKAAMTHNQTQQKAQSYMLYHDFANHGVDKVVREIDNIAVKRWKEGLMGSVHNDVAGNPISEGEQGVTMPIEHEDIRRIMQKNALETENDRNLHNMLLEARREAELFKAIQADPVLRDMNLDLLVNDDMKNNILVESTLELKELKEKEAKLAELEKQLEETTDETQKKNIQAEIAFLKDKDFTNEKSIAYSQKRLDYWTKPLKEELNKDEKPYTTYRYSQGIKDSMMANLVIANALKLRTAIYSSSKVTDLIQESIKEDDFTKVEKALLDEGVFAKEMAADSGFYLKLALNPEYVVKQLNVVNEYMGVISPYMQNLETGEDIFVGLGSIVNLWNNKSDLQQSAEYIIKDFNARLDNINKTIKEGGEGLSSPKDVATEIDALATKMQDAGKIGEAFSSIEEGSELSETLKDFESKMNEAFKEAERVFLEGTEDVDVMVEFASVSNAAKSFSMAQEAIKAETEKAKRLSNIKIDGNLLETNNLSTDETELMAIIAKKILEVSTTDLPLELLTGNMFPLPMEFRGKTLGFFLNYLDMNKNVSLEKGQLATIEMIVEHANAFLTKLKAYMAALEMFKAEEGTDAYAKGNHTMLNNITEQLLNQKEYIEDFHEKARSQFMEAYELLKKNGFVREKDNLRYHYNSLHNDDLYIRVVSQTEMATGMALAIEKDDKGKYYLTYGRNDKKLGKGAKDVDKFIADAINKYIKKRVAEGETEQDVLKQLYDEVEVLKEIGQEYETAFYEIFEKHGIQKSQDNGDGTSTIADMRQMSDMLENAFKEEDLNREVALAKVKDFMMDVHKLQWKTRAKMSGLLYGAMLIMEARLAYAGKTYQTLGEHRGTVLDYNTQYEIQPDQPKYIGTYADFSMQVGYKYFLEETLFFEKMSDEELREYVVRENIDLKGEEANRDNMLDAIYTNLDPNFYAKSSSFAHMVLNNLTIDNYLGGDNLSIIDVFRHIYDYQISRVLESKRLTEQSKDIIKDSLVFEDGILNVSDTLVNLRDNFTSIEGNLLVDELSRAFTELRKNITVEQEQVVFTVIAEHYKSKAGDYGLGLNLNPDPLFSTGEKAVAILGLGGAGKSTMVTEHVVNIINTIIATAEQSEDGSVPAGKKMRVLVMSPTLDINEQQRQVVLRANPEAEVEMKLFEDLDGDLSAFSGDYDLVIVDEAIGLSLQSRPKIKKMLDERINYTQVMYIYDTNQTVNIESPNIIPFEYYGVRAKPLMTRHRQGYIDVNIVSDFFSSDRFRDWAEIGDGSVLPTLFRGMTKIETKWKTYKTAQGNRVHQGVKLATTEEEVIKDYFAVKDRMKKESYQGEKAMIIVVSQEDKARLINRDFNGKRVDANDVYILEHTDKDFNVSGKGAKNVFVLIDYNKVLNKYQNKKAFAYFKLSGHYNTALTRLETDGFVSILYEKGDEHSKKIDDNDILMKYNDALDLQSVSRDENGVFDKEEALDLFTQQMAVELVETHNNNKRHKIWDDVKPGEQSEGDEGGGEPSDDTRTMRSKKANESMAKKFGRVVEKMRNKKANRNAEKVTNLIFSQDNLIEDERQNRRLVMLLHESMRKALAYVYEKTHNSDKDSIEAKRKNYQEAYNEFLKEWNEDNPVDMETFLNYFEKKILTTGAEAIFTASEIGATVVSPVLQGKFTVDGKEKTFYFEPIFMTIVGYTTENGKEVPIVDLYLDDITVLEASQIQQRAEGETSISNQQKAIYAAAMVEQMGYKANMFHFMNITAREGKINVRETLSMTPEQMIGNEAWTKVNEKIGVEESVFSEPDALMKMGVKTELTRTEMLSTYSYNGKDYRVKSAYVSRGDDGVDVKYYNVYSSKNKKSETVLESYFNSNYRNITHQVESSYDLRYGVPEMLMGTSLNFIPEGEIIKKITNANDFYSHDFFKRAYKARRELTKGSKIIPKYIESVNYFTYREKKGVVSTPYMHVLTFENENGDILGVQEAIIHGQRVVNGVVELDYDNVADKTIKAKIDEYINLDYTKEGDERADVLEDELKEYFIEGFRNNTNNDYVEKNAKYQIEKLRNLRLVKHGKLEVKFDGLKDVRPIIRKGNPVMMSDFKGEIETKFQGSQISFKYSHAIKDGTIGFYLDVEIDNVSTPVYVDAQKADAVYIETLRDELDSIHNIFVESFTVMNADKSLSSEEKNEKGKKIAIDYINALKLAHVYDFVYANKKKVEELGVPLFEDIVVDLLGKEEKKKVISTDKKLIPTITAMFRAVLDKAEENLSIGLEDMYNKHIYAESIKYSRFDTKGELRVAEDNLQVNVQTIAHPTLMFRASLKSDIKPNEEITQEAEEGTSEATETTLSEEQEVTPETTEDVQEEVNVVQPTPTIKRGRGRRGQSNVNQKTTVDKHMEEDIQDNQFNESQKQKTYTNEEANNLTLEELKEDFKSFNKVVFSDGTSLTREEFNKMTGDDKKNFLYCI